MKTKTFLLAVMPLLLISCQPAKDDPEILKGVLVAYFDGVASKDLKQLNDVTTSDFILFEDGKIWNNDSLATTLNKYYKKFSAEFTFDYVNVSIDHESGHITYYNHCDCIVNDTSKMSFNWIENATFKKVDGKWKMNFLHSSIKK
ncbi:MAG TPA: nuclear transport factor 2 family protein [Chryseolinea sp.]|nr:nuclear transport factor 2 family protein [Chryseolinea sp.]